MAGLRIVLGNSSLACYAQGGGHWTVFLQYLFGLDALGCHVFLLELYRATGDGARDRRAVESFLERMGACGFGDRCAVLVHDRAGGPATLDDGAVHGTSVARLKDVVRDADLLWNFCCALRRPLLSLFRRRVLIDLDPGHLQVSAISWDLGLADHDVLFTVGAKLGDPDCPAPTLGLRWRPFRPFVHLPAWPARPDPGRSAPFTSVTHWTWEELWWGNRVLSASKRFAYLRYLDLPRVAGRPFELAANLNAEDRTGDRERFTERGWRLVHPYEAAGTPAAYQEYIARSRAEIQCPKPIFRELRTGWFSDRSACYLASGRPVLAEETGFGERLPTGKGLLAFRDLEGAAAGASEIDANYAEHSRAARELAEAYFDSGKCLGAMLDACAGGG